MTLPFKVLFLIFYQEFFALNLTLVKLVFFTCLSLEQCLGGSQYEEFGIFENDLADCNLDILT